MAVDGYATVMAVTTPAAGSSWTATVPAGKRWRMWAGSCRIVTSGTAANRNAFLTYTLGTTVLWVCGQGNNSVGTGPAVFVPASTTATYAFYEFQTELTELYVGNYVPIGCKAMWLPAGTVIALVVQNIKPGDQIDQIGLLIEEVTG